MLMTNDLNIWWGGCVPSSILSFWWVFK